MSTEDEIRSAIQNAVNAAVIPPMNLYAQCVRELVELIASDGTLPMLERANAITGRYVLRLQEYTP